MNAALLEGYVGISRWCTTMLQNQQCQEKLPEKEKVTIKSGVTWKNYNHLQDLPTPFERVRALEFKQYEIFHDFRIFIA